MTVDTTKVSPRRQLHFSSVREILDEAERLQKGNVKALGNWTPGQIYKHLSVPMTACIDGFDFKANFFFRLMGRLMKKRFLSKTMLPGFNITGKAAEKLLPPPTTPEEGLEALRKAVHRFNTETKRMPSPFLGEMTNDEWIQLHCRHAELHLSFLVPE
jgi:hypothetical protein